MSEIGKKTDSKDEFEIISTYYETKENTNDHLQELRETDQKARRIAESIAQLKAELNDIQASCNDAKTKELEACRINKQMYKLKNEYVDTRKQAIQIAKTLDYKVDLECLKLDVDQLTRMIDESAVADDHEDEQLASWIVIKDQNCKIKPKLFNYEQINYENIDNDESFCSCDNGSEKDVCCDFVEEPVTDDCCEQSKALDTDYDKEAIRDDLMATMGEVKLLHRQNCDLLSLLQTTNQQTTTLSNTLRDQPLYAACQKNGHTDTCKLTEIQSNHNEEDKNKLEELTVEYNCVLADIDNKSKEITDLKKQLDAAIHESKTYQDRLVISNTRITLLEKELFDLKSSKSHNTAIVRSNDKYLIENLKHRLFEAKAEISNMQMVLEYHLAELEDKKAKYLEVLQTHHEQKYRIETLLKEKAQISEEFEKEFNRMDAHLKACFEEIGTLPAKLASAQQDFEKEKSARMALEEERNTLLNDIDSLKASLALENNAGKDKIIKDLEEQNKQLTATVMNLEDILKENKRLYTERTHYALQLNDHLNSVREEAAIQVTKMKDFSECQKLKYKEYIQQLETKLAESRAIACAEIKKRDQVDEHLKNRIEILTKNLNEAKLKIAEVVNVKTIIENNSREELCKAPGILNSICNR